MRSLWPWQSQILVSSGGILCNCCCLNPLYAGMESLSEGPALPERERRFLGCIRVPLAAVYQAEVIYGAFKVRALVSAIQLYVLFLF